MPFIHSFKKKIVINVIEKKKEKEGRREKPVKAYSNSSLLSLPCLSIPLYTPTKSIVITHSIVLRTNQYPKKILSHNHHH